MKAANINSAVSVQVADTGSTLHSTYVRKTNKLICSRKNRVGVKAPAIAAVSMSRRLTLACESPHPR